MPKMLVVTYLH